MFILFHLDATVAAAPTVVSYLFSKCGGLQLSKQALAPSSRYFAAIGHLPYEASLETQAAALSILQYFSKAPSMALRAAKLAYNRSLKESSDAPIYDEMHAADIAQRAKPFPSEKVDRFLTILTAQAYGTSFVLDIVLPANVEDLSQEEDFKLMENVFHFPHMPHVIQQSTNYFHPHERLQLNVSLYTDPMKEIKLLMLQSSSPQLTEQMDLVNELKQTEHTYVSRLQHLLAAYKYPLQEKYLAASTSTLSAEKLSLILPNALEEIYDVNYKFLRDIGPSSSLSHVIELIWDHLKGFVKCYETYIKWRTKNIGVLGSALLESDIFEHDESVRNETNMPVRLTELLMEPIQRIPRLHSYSGLFGEAHH